MARVTVEDCIDRISNRFKLVLMASHRARDLSRGTKPSVPKDNDKPAIIALREIAEETISLEGLETLTKRDLIEKNNATDSSEIMQSNIFMEEEEEKEETLVDENDLEILRDTNNVFSEKNSQLDGSNVEEDSELTEL